MGVDFTMMANPKYKGIPFHELNEEDVKKCEKELEKDPSSKSLLDTVITEDQFHYLKEITTFISELSSEYLSYSYCYIDTHNLRDVLQKIREKIDELLHFSNRYHADTYGDHSDLYFWSTLYTKIQYFSEAFDANQWYILMVFV